MGKVEGSRNLRFSVTLFILVQSMCLILLLFWIYWFFSNDSVYAKLADYISPEFLPVGKGAGLFIAGLALVLLISTGLTFIFIRLLKQLKVNKPEQGHCGGGKSEYRFNGNRIDFRNLTCNSANGSFSLTPLEAELLYYFVTNENRVITREELLVHVWHIDSETETRTVDNFIVRLRKYFEPDPANPVFFRNVRSRGYLFKV